MFSVSGFNLHIWTSTILGLNDKIEKHEQKILNRFMESVIFLNAAATEFLNFPFTVNMGIILRNFKFHDIFDLCISKNQKH